MDIKENLTSCWSKAQNSQEKKADTYMQTSNILELHNETSLMNTKQPILNCAWIWRFKNHTQELYKENTQLTCQAKVADYQQSKAWVWIWEKLKLLMMIIISPLPAKHKVPTSTQPQVGFSISLVLIEGGFGPHCLWVWLHKQNKYLQSMIKLWNLQQFKCHLEFIILGRKWWC